MHTHTHTHTHTQTRVSKLIHTPSHEPLTSMHSRVNYWRAWHLSITRECMRVYGVLFMQRRRCTRGHARARTHDLPFSTPTSTSVVLRLNECVRAVMWLTMCVVAPVCSVSARRYSVAIALPSSFTDWETSEREQHMTSPSPAFGQCSARKGERLNVYSTSKHVSSCDPIPLYLL